MDKRTLILEAALKLIDEQGIHNAPMSKIAKEANVAAGSLYNYFENKQCLVNEIYTHIKQKMNGYLVRNINEQAPIEEKLFDTFRSLFDFYIENPVEGKFLTQYSFSTYVTDDLVDTNLKMFEEYINLISKAICGGYLRDIPVSIILSIVIGSIKEVHYQAALGEIEIDNSTAKNVYEAIASGLKK